MFVFFLANMDGLYSSGRVGVSMRRNVLSAVNYSICWSGKITVAANYT